MYGVYSHRRSGRSATLVVRARWRRLLGARGTRTVPVAFLRSLVFSASEGNDQIYFIIILRIARLAATVYRARRFAKIFPFLSIFSLFFFFFDFIYYFFHLFYTIIHHTLVVHFSPIVPSICQRAAYIILLYYAKNKTAEYFYDARNHDGGLDFL